jgi:hypothetical protein
MPILTNLTPFAVGEIVGLDAPGAEVYCAVVKGTFVWKDDGSTQPVDVQPPLLTEDVYSGEPGLSGMVMASELGFPKPAVDVLLAGEVMLGREVEQADVTLQVGAQIRKVVRVFGKRIWMPGAVKALALTKPRPFTRMPITWENSFGGADAANPKLWEPRNPVGAGLWSSAKACEGKPAPNFEDPAHPIDKHTDRPAPVGFGPIAPHWQPRISLAGTYDQRWTDDRFPLLPDDFQAAFLNVAPADQRLTQYRSGDEVRLLNLTPPGRERFTLPSFQIPITLVDDEGSHAQNARVDTVIIEPARRCLSVIARAQFRPYPDGLAIRHAIIGEMSSARRRAIERGKTYVGSAGPQRHVR